MLSGGVSLFATNSACRASRRSKVSWNLWIGPAHLNRSDICTAVSTEVLARKRCASALSDPVNFRGSALRSPKIEESAGSPAKREQWRSDGVRSRRQYTVRRLRNNGLRRLGPIEEGDRSESDAARRMRTKRAGSNEAKRSEGEWRR